MSCPTAVRFAGLAAPIAITSSSRDHFILARATMPPSTEVKVDEYGARSFRIETVGGQLHTRAYWRGWEYTGTAEALTSFGLIRP